MMTAEIPLKFKHRVAKPKGTNRPDYSGNQGTSVKLRTVPLGMRKRYKRGAKRYT